METKIDLGAIATKAMEEIVASGVFEGEDADDYVTEFGNEEDY